MGNQARGSHAPCHQNHFEAKFLWVSSRVKYTEGLIISAPVLPPAQHTDNLATARLVQEQYAKQLVAEHSDLLTGIPGWQPTCSSFQSSSHGQQSADVHPQLGLTCWELEAGLALHHSIPYRVQPYSPNTLEPQESLTPLGKSLNRCLSLLCQLSHVLEWTQHRNVLMAFGTQEKIWIIEYKRQVH